MANRGSGHPNYKHGRRSKYLSTQIGARFAEALADPELLEYKQDVALLDALLGDTLESIGKDSGSAVRRWTEVTNRLLDFEVAMAMKNQEKRQEAFVRLKHAISEGTHDAEARAEARVLIQERVKIAEKENARLQKLENVMTAEQAFTLFSAIMHEAGRIIKDSGERAAFNGAMAKLSGELAVVA